MSQFPVPISYPKIGRTFPVRRLFLESVLNLSNIQVDPTGPFALPDAPVRLYKFISGVLFDIL